MREFETQGLFMPEIGSKFEITDRLSIGGIFRFQISRDKKRTYEKRPIYLSFQKNVHIDEKTGKNLRI